MARYRSQLDSRFRGSDGFLFGLNSLTVIPGSAGIQTESTRTIRFSSYNGKAHWIPADPGMTLFLMFSEFPSSS